MADYDFNEYKISTSIVKEIVYRYEKFSFSMEIAVDDLLAYLVNPKNIPLLSAKN